MPNHFICTLSDAPTPGRGQHFDLPDGVGGALFNIAGEFFAIKDSCPHMDSPIHDGIVHREVVTCRWHGWQFDLRTGVSLMSDRIRIQTYPVRVRDGEIWVDLP